MFVINVKNVQDALGKGIQLINAYGEQRESRDGKTLELLAPVATVYRRPWERVLIDEARDANPFFHMMEALWILDGRHDVKFLVEFNKQMANYSDDGETFNAPYGFRIRENFNLTSEPDQLESVINILKTDPDSRQAVVQIWTPYDLNKQTKDKACNMSIVFRIRDNKLCMTVYNRSNDMIWGAYGANAVQFSMIQEYVAAHLDLPLGEYTQISNSFHVYTEGKKGETWERVRDGFDTSFDPYSNFHNLTHMIHEDMNNFNIDLKLFFIVYDIGGINEILTTAFKSIYFNSVVIPMLRAHRAHKLGNTFEAIKLTGNILSDDWEVACENWLQKRLENQTEVK